ncbi:MAG: hypothetical protein MJ081_08975 [Ruminococcus sp.]|nr:hypothetical protein [Ruminococcus sp.]
MKKVISVATTAAMTLSMLSVPAMICSAAEEVATSVSVVLQDQTIEKGLTTFTVPVSLTKDTALSSAELKLSTKAYPGGRYVAKIDSVESAVEGLTVTLENGTVTVSGSADVKKGETVFNLKVKLLDPNGNMAATIPDNANFKLSVDSAKIGETTLTDAEKEEAAAFLFVRPAKKTADCSFTLDSVNVTSTASVVSVPVTVNGSYGVFSTRFRASNGAVIKSVTIPEGSKVEASKDGKGIVFADMNADADTKFDNEVVAYVNVQLPADAVSGQSFKVTTKYFDAYNFEDTAIYPEKLENSDIIYVLKGDADLSNALKQVDATLILRDILSREVNKKSLLAETYETTKTKNAEVAATVENCGMDKLVNAAMDAIDVNADNKVTATDATYILKYLLAHEVDDNFKDKTFDEYLGAK